MPVYNYKCDTCGNTFELRQSINDQPLTHCLENICQSEVKGRGVVHRVISKNIGFVFNGNGFYLTDYVQNKKESSNSKQETINSNSCSTGVCGCNN